MWIVVRECRAIVAVGVLIGLPPSLWTSRLVASELFGVSAGDPLTLAVATALVTAAAIIELRKQYKVGFESARLRLASKLCSVSLSVYMT